MQKAIKRASIMTAFVAIISGAAIFTQPKTSAVDHVVTGGQTIQAAIDAANEGDKVIIPAGTYNESFAVYNKKNIEIVGQGAVIINSQPGFPSPTAYKGITIVDSEGVTLRNVTVDGAATATTSPDWVTGIDAVGAPNLTFDNVTVQNFGKNGIAINAAITGSSSVSGAPADLVTSNVTFSNVTAKNTGWAGIAFYGQDSNDSSKIYDITGVSFVGTTTIEETTYGIQFGGTAADTGVVTGPSGATVDLGTVVFVNNDENVTNPGADVAVIISPSSTINGTPVTAADFTGLNVTIEDPKAPEVPNTGVSR